MAHHQLLRAQEMAYRPSPLPRRQYPQAATTDEEAQRPAPAAEAARRGTRCRRYQVAAQLQVGHAADRGAVRGDQHGLRGIRRGPLVALVRFAFPLFFLFGGACC